MHLGNVLSFLITASLAEKKGAEILLRIDDLDQPRASDRYIEDIFETLDFLHIPWMEGPGTVAEFKEKHSQVQRLRMYADLLQQLADNKQVFACSCSRKQASSAAGCSCLNRNISLNAPNVSWRLRTNDQQLLGIKTVDGEMAMSPSPSEMKNFVVKKKDGMPAYQLTSVVDDLFYGISLVVRGVDLWPSTLAQMYIAHAAGLASFGEIEFYHHPLICNERGEKLSKSAGATSIRYLRNAGKSPADIYHIIAKDAGLSVSEGTWRELGGALLTKSN